MSCVASNYRVNVAPMVWHLLTNSLVSLPTETYVTHTRRGAKQPRHQKSQVAPLVSIPSCFPLPKQPWTSGTTRFPSHPCSTHQLVCFICRGSPSRSQFRFRRIGGRQRCDGRSN
ncbi:hypothetical protein M752DRAFT_122153 [Aspergillus phoenicis ATCC 13157]|uniref:Uncharacterized protein n=1 Tax=Aspergillus phoenicis ATCC 13157 TaxID=1353007 RepID=A0A370PU67_ASPPH|nr:hypothetical protein M752DRAFT_122153 [Aspergillus phoenicis ATCC 13157]